MPEFIRILTVDPPRESLPVHLREKVCWYPETGESEHTEVTLDESLEALGRAMPGVECRLLFQVADQARFGVRAVSSEPVRPSPLRLFSRPRGSRTVLLRDRVRFSRMPNGREACGSWGFVELDIEAVEIVDELTPHLARESHAHWEGRRLWLPLRWESLEAAVQAGALIAQYMCAPTVALPAEVSDRFGELVLVKKVGATLTPVYPVTSRSLQALASSVLLPLEFSTLAGCPGEWKPKHREAVRTPTSGSPSARVDAVYDLVEQARDGAELWETLRTALAAPQNQGSRYAAVRKKLVEVIFGRWELVGEPFLHGTPRRSLPNTPSLEARCTEVAIHLQTEEDADVRRAIYNAFSRTGLEVAHAQLIRNLGGIDDSYLREVLPRHRKSLEILLRDRVLKAWVSEPAEARRWIQYLRDEFVRLPADLVLPLPEDVSAELRDLQERAPEKASP